MRHVWVDMAAHDPGSSQRLAQLGWRQMGLGAHLETSWAFICGLVASGRVEWLPGRSLRILTLWLAVDVVLGLVLWHWSQLRSRLREGANRRADVRGPIMIPYALPGSPGGRFVAWVNRSLAVCGSEREAPWILRDVVAIMLGILVASVLATYVGPDMLGALGLGVVAWGLMALASRQPAARRAAADQTAQAGEVDLFTMRAHALQVGLAWLVAHAALAPWRPHTVGLAALFCLLAYLRERLLAGGAGRALWLSRAVWVLVLSALLIARQPIVAMMVAICALGSDLALALARGGGAQEEAHSGPWSARVAWLMAALVAAAASTFWG
jgi:hypothetical protein